MGNILKDIRSIVAPNNERAKIGTVTRKNSAGLLVVTTSSGATYNIVGTAEVNDTVLFSENKIISRLKKETTRVYYL